MTTKTLAKLYTNSFRSNWDNLAFSDYEGADFKFSDIAKIIKSLHLFYRKMELKDGDKIAVLGRNSAHWGATFLSAISARLVIVPVLPDFNETDTNHIINHSEAKIIVATQSLIEKIDLKKAENLKAVIVMEDFSLHSAKNEKARDKLYDAFQFYNENVLTPETFTFEKWEKEEACVISYTSGTSGFTKGVLIPERSLVSNIIFAQEHMPLKQGDKIVSFLPMAHVYGLLFEFLFPVTLGCQITFLNKMPSPVLLTKVLSEVRPHLILSVPLIIEKIYTKRLQPTIEKPVMKILLAIPGISSILLKKIRSKLIKTFGGRFFEIVIGGAPLNADVERFFKQIKFPFSIGYGMTECGPLISYEAWDKTRTSSAGRLVDRMQVRIDSEDPYNIVGEIQVKGENVMLGYFKNEKATAESFTEDGWLKTGDLGVIDKDQFLFIRGRSKNMILGPSGQNIYPEEIEAKLTGELYVAECIVTKRNQKLVALVLPDFEAMKRDKVDEKSVPEIMEDNRKKANNKLPKYEQISKIEVVSEEFEKTPKRNIKRFKYI